MNGIVIDPSSRFSGLIGYFLTKCANLFFVTYLVKYRYFLCDAPGVFFFELIFKSALLAHTNKIFLKLKR
ncbi:hypothetical protein DTG75_09525 [Salmonella enterica subsp. salamae]|uniref:Uncharacterized protein n=1 Tax=Salmonella enterica subsp. salamae serovar 55:k:z39 str. 1315K TaxID=1243602 RepID=A0A6C7CEG9_SALER|nr:hypothetical protein LFZ47_01145 [Salmonella enterica subsp. salamae serovar 55:k:z39 str. 1315K]ECG1248322.1 hypothetical protein [Salmonella enterica subsp. salamae]ECG1476519.1 hypothetical protein [Salmonella enterica subsp. salamae]MJZ02313.1 hypothetical protein [Salmonella enterica subsp. salamae]